jgi:hypothetical protein
MPGKRKDGRSVKGIALNDANWELLDAIARQLGTNRSNLLENLVNEFYGNKYDKNGNLKKNNEDTKNRSKASK